MTSTLERAERAVAALLTVMIVGLHIVVAFSAGPLWRDEANTVGLVTLPRFRDVWANLQYDSFPILWLSFVRGLASIAGVHNDFAFRIAGLLIGLAVLGILWLYARTLLTSYPLVSLALFGLSPSLIVWGDSLRAYGLGIFLGLSFAIALWRFVQLPTLTRCLIAAALAVASVQTLFYNCILILAFCAGAAALCVHRRNTRLALAVVLIGGVAAISLVPYSGPISGAASWNRLVQVPHYTFAWFLNKLDETLRPAGSWGFFVWLECFVLAVFVGQRTLRLSQKLGISPEKRDVALFSMVALAVGVPAYYFFLKTLSYVTSAWYYLALLALSAVCMDLLFEAWMTRRRARVARLVAVVLVAVATIPNAYSAARTRRSNVDLVTNRIRTVASKGDMVVVAPWFDGVSFARYYTGPAEWMTLPQINFTRFHRYDLVKREMLAPDHEAKVEQVLERLTRTLRTGHRIIVVGALRFPSANDSLPAEGEIWAEEAFRDKWSLTLGEFLKANAMSLRSEYPKSANPINHFEDMDLIVAEGWRSGTD